LASERASQGAFLGVSALLFAASAAVTIVWCASMSVMGEMPMPGGWTMSMVWMRMPGQTWPGAAASFLGIWVVMMVAMMLPSLIPILWRYRQAVGWTGETRLGRLITLVGVGYFFVWTVFGMAAFPLGVALAEIEMQQPALARTVPIAVGVVILIAGALQFTAWKSRHLACCREAPGRGRMLSADAGTAWRHGNYATTKTDGLLWAGTTEEEAGFDEETTLAARDEIGAALVRMLPAMADAQIAHQTACLRPLASDGGCSAACLAMEVMSRWYERRRAVAAADAAAGRPVAPHSAAGISGVSPR